MSFDFRKIVIIFIIGILTVVLAHAFTLAIQPKPEHNDYCKGRVEPPYPVYPTKPYDERSTGPTCEPYQFPTAEQCVNEKGYVEYKYNASGCPYDAFCNYCQRDFDAAQQQWNFTLFVVYLIVAALAIVTGLFLSPKKAEINRWLGTGFLLGGLICIFVATVVYFTQLNRYVRPILILAELVLVVYLSYRQFRKEKK